ncbi:MAG: hypothetical protein DDG60_12425 [Anaerolineae bacterium]|nr:MAG: hypothetical protein DDG60_12425 [Anaerolineae bacterium]
MKKLSFLTLGLLMTWFFVSLSLFMLVNRATYLQVFIFPEMLPWEQDSFRVWNGWTFTIDILCALGGVGIFSLAMLATGLIFLRREQVSPVQFLTAFILGEVVLSVVLLSVLSLTGLSPRLTGWLLSLFALPGTFWLARTARERLLDLPFKRFALDWHPLQWVLLLVYLAALGLTSTRLGYDAAAYYFAQARLMAVTGQAVFTYSGDAFVVSSFHPGILFTAVIQMFGDQAARMLSWVNGGVIVLTGWEIGKAAGLSARARWFFLTLILTSTAFVDLLGDGKVELISTAPLVVALWWMMDSLQNSACGRFLLIGALLGFSIIARPYNLFLVPVFTVWFYLLQVWPVLRREGLAAALRFARPVLWMFPTLLLMGIFHLWQNDRWLGSPLGPLTYARELDSSDWQWQFDPALLTLLRLLYPLALTFLNTPQSLGNISPLFAGFLPFLLLPEVRARLRFSAPFRSLLFPALLTLLLWISLFFTVVEIRYVFFLWVLLFLFGAQVIEAVFEALPNGYQRLLSAALTVLLAFVFVRTVVIALATYSPVGSSGQAHCDDVPLCTFLQPLNESAPPGARVFVLHAYRYYLRPDLFACSSLSDETEQLSHLSGSGKAFWTELYRLGFEYVTYEKHYALLRARFGALPALTEAPDWMTVEELISRGQLVIYRLHVRQPPFAPLKTCLPTSDGGWQVREK